MKVDYIGNGLYYLDGKIVNEDYIRSLKNKIKEKLDEIDNPRKL